MATSACSQKVNNSDDWIKKLEDPEDDSYILKPENFIEKYKSYDFSPLFIPKTEFIGFIGNDFRRILIKFISIKKDPIQTIYNVVGSSLVLNNQCNFTGTIKVR